MWEITNARATVPIAPEDFQGEISYFPHLAKTGPDMGHGGFKTEVQQDRF
jgi:hypothetical protein